MKTQDQIGKKFNRLTVIEIVGKNKHGWPVANCRCECGVFTSVPIYYVTSGNTTSCGCRLRENQERGNYKHGRALTPEWKCWVKMRERCTNQNLPIYKRYGAKGISVCARWMESFENFFADMGEMPSPLHNTVDRIKNEGNYEPANCRWATRREQALNRKRTVWFTYKGETLCKLDWAKRFRVNQSAIGYWLKKGWTFDRIAEHFQPKVIAA